MFNIRKKKENSTVEFQDFSGPFWSAHRQLPSIPFSRFESMNIARLRSRSLPEIRRRIFNPELKKLVGEVIRHSPDQKRVE